MMTRRHMAVGEWDIPLLPSTPRNVRRILEISSDDGHGFNSLIVTPARWNLADVDVADLFDLAEFVGVHNRTDGLTLSGPGVEFWLGDEDGKGMFIQPTFGTKSFATWVAEIVGSNGVVTEGSTESIAGVDLEWDPPYGISTRDALDYICRIKGAEWRVNFDLTVDSGQASTLYSSTPKAIVGAVGTGGLEPGGYRGVTGKVSKVAHLEDYAYGAWVWDSDGNIGSDSRASAPYYAPSGVFWPDVNIVDSSPTPVDLDVQASARLVYGDDTLKRTYMVEGLGTRKPLRDIGGPGDYLYVFDPGALLLDKTNQIVYRGGPVWPIKLRIVAVSTPLRRGQGVVYHYWDADAVGYAAVDLSDFVDWSAEADAEASLEVGNPSDVWSSAVRAKYEDWLSR